MLQAKRAPCAQVTVVAVALVTGCSATTVNITRTQDELQQKLAPRFPVTKEKSLLSVTLSDPKVLLRPGDTRVGLDVATRLKIPLGTPVDGRIGVVGRPHYDPEQKAFFLRDAEIETLTFPGVDLEGHHKIRMALQAAVRLALETTPVYTLEERNFKEVTAKHFLRKVHVADGKLELTLGL